MERPPVGDYAWLRMKQLGVVRWEIVTRMLSGLRAHVYSPKGDLFLPIGENPPSWYLDGDRKRYEEYCAFNRKHKNPGDPHTSARFEKLIASIHKCGYDETSLMVIYDDENIIRDGQHRASVLLKFFGDHEVIVVMAYTGSYFAKQGAC